MASVLHDCGRFTQPMERLRLIEAVAGIAPDPLRVEFSDHAMTHLMFLVRDCAAANCLDLLVDELAPRLEPSYLAELRRLHDEWNGLDQRFTDVEWQMLRAQLESLSLANLDDIYRRTRRFDFQSPPEHCHSVWNVFAYLAGLNSGDRVPRFMIFLWLVTDQLPSGRATPVRDLLDHKAREWRITEAFQRERYRLDRAPDQQRWDPALLILIEQVPLTAEFTVQHWKQWSAETMPIPGEDRFVPEEALEETVQEIVAAAEADAPLPFGRLRIEFLLPTELLNLPVEGWSKEIDPFDGPVPLYRYHPVMVRSLERIRDRRRLAEWRRRWHSLHNDPRAAEWLASRGPGHMLEEEITRDERIVTMVLSEPPPGGPDGAAREIRIALRTGIPIVIWHRSLPPSPPFLQLIEELVAGGGMAELPDRASKLRITASMADDENEVGRGLVLLWDDPFRMPGGLGAATGR